MNSELLVSLKIKTDHEKRSADLRGFNIIMSS